MKHQILKEIKFINIALQFSKLFNLEAMTK